MPSSKLPDRASLEYLRKLAKERLTELRRRKPQAKLAEAQLAIAREHGFPSWRALKAEIDKRRAPLLETFFTAGRAGDVATLRQLLANDPGLVHERTVEGSTCLHLAAAHPDALRLLLQHGADPNARDVGDNAGPLFSAAGPNEVESMRVLLDAGADVRGVGDVHQLEVIGWATCFGPTIPHDVVRLLVERGAKHHIFSAIAMQDLDLIRQVVAENPKALSRRMSRFEQGQSALHYVIAPPDGLLGGGFRTGQHYAMLDLLIELGADLEAKDDKGRTPLEVAMLRGDEEAMRRLNAAGARMPKPKRDAPDFNTRIAELGRNVKSLQVMIQVPNVRAALDWYRSVGFQLSGEFSVDTAEAWAGVYLGGAYVMFVPGGAKAKEHSVSLWFMTERIDDLFHLLKERQLDRSRDVLEGREPKIPELRFTSELHDTFYGQREFSIEDLNGYDLNFAQSLQS